MRKDFEGLLRKLSITKQLMSITPPALNFNTCWLWHTYFTTFHGQFFCRRWMILSTQFRKVVKYWYTEIIMNNRTRVSLLSSLKKKLSNLCNWPTKVVFRWSLSLRHHWRVTLFGLLDLVFSSIFPCLSFAFLLFNVVHFLFPASQQERRRKEENSHSGILLLLQLFCTVPVSSKHIPVQYL